MITNNESTVEIDRLQDIIKDLNNKIKNSVDRNVHANVISENDALKETINALENQVKSMNQTIDSLRNNAQLADKLARENIDLTNSLDKLQD